MKPDRSTPPKPPGSQRSFPWTCAHCGKLEVVMTTTEYPTEVRHDGRLHTFTIPDLAIPRCNACGESIFTEEVDHQVRLALRKHLNLLAPEDIRHALDKLHVTQKELAERLGIAEATVSRWLNATQIQSRALDNLLRLFFALPEVRTALSGDLQGPLVGLSTEETRANDLAQM